MEGIIFGGYLLCKEDFITIFKEFYEQKNQEFLTKYQTLVNSYKRNIKINKAAILKTFEKISKELFGNDEIQLLAMIQMPDSNNYNFTKTVNENKFYSKNTLSLSKNRLKQVLLDYQNNINAQILQDELNRHLSDFLNDVSSIPDNNWELIYLHIYYYYHVTTEKLHFSDKTYDEIIYRGINQKQGQKVDAFMNHIANYHREILSYLQNIDLMNENYREILFDKSVKTEEGSNFCQLLLNSLNHTTGLASGDLVVTDSSHKVIYNIQLKSTISKKGSQSYHLNLKEYNQMLKDLGESMKINSTEIAETLYEYFKTTSSNEINEAESKLDESSLNFVRKNLGLKEIYPISIL